MQAYQATSPRKFVRSRNMQVMSEKCKIRNLILGYEYLVRLISDVSDGGQDVPNSESGPGEKRGAEESPWSSDNFSLEVTSCLDLQ